MRKIITPKKDKAVIINIKEQKLSPKKKIMPTFPREHRMGRNISFKTPAPNAYQDILNSKEINISTKVKATLVENCTFGFKPTKFIDTNPNPGPGKYFPEMPKKKFNKDKLGGIPDRKSVV